MRWMKSVHKRKLHWRVKFCGWIWTDRFLKTIRLLIPMFTAMVIVTRKVWRGGRWANVRQWAWWFCQWRNQWDWGWKKLWLAGDPRKSDTNRNEKAVVYFRQWPNMGTFRNGLSRRQSLCSSIAGTAVLEVNSPGKKVTERLTEYGRIRDIYIMEEWCILLQIILTVEEPRMKMMIALCRFLWRD